MLFDGRNKARTLLRNLGYRHSRPASLATSRPRSSPGEGIVASSQSADRDEDVFANQDSFDMYRKRWDEEALGFGYGPHRYIGEWLARVELDIVFCKYAVSRSSLKGLVINGTCETTLFRKLPNLRLAIPFEEITHSPRGRDVGINELQVTCGETKGLNAPRVNCGQTR